MTTIVDSNAASVSQPSLGHGEVAALLSSIAREVFGTMLGADINVGETREETLNKPMPESVVAWVGVGGRWSGSGRISCSPASACMVASKFLMSEYTEVNEDVLDAMAEVANMVIGNTKTALEGRLGAGVKHADGRLRTQLPDAVPRGQDVERGAD